MGLRTFKGGIHPDDGKALAKDQPIQKLTPAGDLVYPVSMHGGAPAKPVVSVGDSVLSGQIIAEAGGFVSAPVHASVSGTVKAIEPRVTATGGKVMSIIVENDNHYNEVVYPERKPLEEQSKEEILNAIKEAGISGMGGAGFPTHVKLSPKEPAKIEYVIANCAECEPYITADYRCMLEKSEELIGGLKAVLRLFDNAKGILAIEDNKKDCIEKLTKLTAGESRIEVAGLHTKYPQGSERQLIYAVTGRAINCEMLPADVGAIVDNVGTLIAINQAVTEGKPLNSRVITISGDAASKPGNYQVPIGMSQKEVLEASGGCSKKVSKYISGGPMMGFAMYTIDVPVTKTTSALLCVGDDIVAKTKTTACINCGRCVEVCPGRIVPSRLSRYVELGNQELFLAWNGMECCECGCCSFVCPAKRPLKQLIAGMRQTVLAERRQKKATK